MNDDLVAGLFGAIAPLIVIVLLLWANKKLKYAPTTKSGSNTSHILAKIILFSIVILVAGFYLIMFVGFGGIYIVGYTHKQGENPSQYVENGKDLTNSVNENIVPQSAPHSANEQSPLKATPLYKASGDTGFSLNYYRTDTCPFITHSMVIGSTDATTEGQVTLLQDFLNLQNRLSGSFTGYFDEETSIAVANWQRYIGFADELQNPGTVGPRTIQQINGLCEEMP